MRAAVAETVVLPNRQEVVQVPITPAMRAAAYAHEAQVEQAVAGRPYNGLQEPNHWYNGTLGELGLEHVLQARRIRYRVERRADGRSDRGIDAIVYHQGRPWTIDVKTASRDYYKLCMITEDQYSKKDHCDVVIGARLVGGMVMLHGWVPWGEVARWPLKMVKAWSRCWPLADLRPIEGFLRRLDRI